MIKSEDDILRNISLFILDNPAPLPIKGEIRSRVSRGNETNVKTQLFRRKENKRLVSFCPGIFTLLTNLSVPRWNETNHNLIVISFIPS